MVSIILKVIIIYREKKATPDVKAQTFVLAKKSKQNDQSIKKKTSEIVVNGAIKVTGMLASQSDMIASL